VFATTFTSGGSTRAGLLMNSGTTETSFLRHDMHQGRVYPSRSPTVALFYKLSVCKLFSDKILDDREQLNGKEIEGNGRVIIYSLHRHMPGGVEENHENP
jgi:hypothetical protein